MIIWLASYPKSGNTWVRSFLTTLMYSHHGQNDFSNLAKITQFPLKKQFINMVDDFKNITDLAKNWIPAQDLINLNEGIKLIKTHNMNCSINNYDFTNHKNTLGVIHIVRDPRNVVISLRNHYSKTIEDAKKFLFNENSWLGLKEDYRSINENDVPTILGSWQTHYASWKNKTQNYLLIKYEDLIDQPNETFNKISDYISSIQKIKFQKTNIDKSILSNSFENLQKLEERGMFKEYAMDKKGEKIKFFNLGPKNIWQNILDDKIAKEIEIKFFDVMKELKYID